MSISSLLDLVPTVLGALALFAFIYLGLIVRERWQLLTKAAGVQSLEIAGATRNRHCARRNRSQCHARHHGHAPLVLA